MAQAEAVSNTQAAHTASPIPLPRSNVLLDLATRIEDEGAIASTIGTLMCAFLEGTQNDGKPLAYGFYLIAEKTKERLDNISNDIRAANNLEVLKSMIANRR